MNVVRFLFFNLMNMNSAASLLWVSYAWTKRGGGVAWTIGMTAREYQCMFECKSNDGNSRQTGRVTRYVAERDLHATVFCGDSYLLREATKKHGAHVHTLEVLKGVFPGREIIERACNNHIIVSSMHTLNFKHRTHPDFETQGLNDVLAN